MSAASPAASPARHRWVALLRGINVGGHRSVKMAALREAFEAQGATNVRTVVQSGNVVFDHASAEGAAPALRAQLASGLAAAFGFDIPVVLRSARQFAQRAAADPFAAQAAEPQHAHVWFLEHAPPRPDTAGLDRLKADSERWHLAGDAFYLHAPEGIGRSKLAAGAERLLGVAATARNLRTVQTLGSMLDD
jgi:uncharacterized protein (DUF1697 family)